MGLSRKVGFFQGFRYQGGGAMLAWMLHRITGVGLLVLAGLHVLASFFAQQAGAGWAEGLNAAYAGWPVQAVIVFCVIFHGLNGLRIALLDLWPGLLVYRRQALWLQLLILAPVYLLATFVLIRRALAGE